MRPDDRLICALVKAANKGQKFTDWPLHLTVVPWFRVELSSNNLAKMLSAKLIGMPALQLKVESRDKFGYSRKEVALLDHQSELICIEKIVREKLKDQDAWIVDESTRLRREFSPHVTDQKNESLQVGDEFLADRLYIVSQHGEYKQIDAEVPLGITTTT